MPRFDVASVKPNPNPKMIGAPAQGDGSVRGTLTVNLLISHAYEVPVWQVAGGPGWTETDAFDIDARPGSPTTKAQTNAMLRTLLAERFGLVVRKDPNFTVMKWTLKVARDDGRLGPSIRHASQDCIPTSGFVAVSQRQIRPLEPVPCGRARDAQIAAAGGVPMSDLIFFIQLALGDEVVDRTGLSGLFDFHARIPPAAGTYNVKEDERPSIFTVVQEELGMKLQREEIMRETIVVERVSRPLPN